MVNEEKKKALKVMLNGVIDSFFEAYGNTENSIPQVGPYYGPTIPQTQFHPAYSPFNGANPYPSVMPQSPMSWHLPQMPTPKGLTGQPPRPFGLVLEEIKSGNISSKEEEDNKKTIIGLKRIFEWGLENSLCEKYMNVSRGLLILERTVSDTGEKLCDEIDVFVKYDDGSVRIIIGCECGGFLLTMYVNAPVIVYSTNNNSMSYVIPIDCFDPELVNRYCTRTKPVTKFIERKHFDYEELQAMISPQFVQQTKSYNDLMEDPADDE